MEHSIQNQIRAAVSPTCAIFRTNSGDFWQGDLVYSKEFRQTVLINIRKIDGLPKGFSDLCGVRKSDGRAVFIEVKTERGRASDKQRQFLAKMREYGAIAGVARSVEDALKLIQGTEQESLTELPESKNGAGHCPVKLIEEEI